MKKKDFVQYHNGNIYSGDPITEPCNASLITTHTLRRWKRKAMRVFSESPNFNTIEQTDRAIAVARDILKTLEGLK